MRAFIIIIVFISTMPFISNAQLTALKVTEGGKTYTLYKVQKGDGWYGIARQFGISYAELRMANKKDGDGLEIGQMVRIPGKLKANDPYFRKNYMDSANAAPSNNIPVNPAVHIVDKKETLFSIAKRYNVTVEQVKKWNRLTSNSISIGQKLIINASESVPRNEAVEKTPVETAPAEKKTTEPLKEIIREKVEPAPVDVPDESGTKDDKRVEVPRETISIKPVPVPVSGEAVPGKSVTTHREPKVTINATTLANGRKEITENGLATWIDDEQTAPNKYFALHRTAANGTVIRITNKVNSRTVFVKVVGKLQSSPEDVVISVSKAAAEKLGVEDDRFQAELVYGVAPEE